MELSQVTFSKHRSADEFKIAVLKVRSWQGITAQLVRIEEPTVFNFRVSATSHYIALHDIYRIDGETAASNVQTSYARDLRNKITYLPEGSRLDGWCKIDQPATMLSVTIDPFIIRDLAPNLNQLAPRLEFEDQTLRSHLSQFWKILDDGSRDDLGTPASLAKRLASELEHCSREPRQHNFDHSGLGQRQFELVIQYMDENLNKAVSVSELAKLLDYSTSHFIRAFTQRAGLTPYQFLIRRRVELAQELLKSSRIRIGELSAKLGFCGSAQFARAFRRYVGTTPSKFRRAFT